jgi:putative integral membrane protein (TIGR02587 family)
MHPDSHWWEVAVESVEELGIALALSPLVLFLLGRIGSETAWQEIVGVSVIEAMTVAIGVSVGTAQLQGQNNGGGDSPRSPIGMWGETVLAFCGAFLFTANIAPTEEVMVIGFEADPLRLIGTFALSLVLGAVTLFYSGFVRAKHYVRHETALQVVYGIVVSYAAALVASALVLWFFGRFDGVPVSIMIAQIVVLGLPGMLGASAGRLLIQ